MEATGNKIARLPVLPQMGTSARLGLHVLPGGKRAASNDVAAPENSLALVNNREDFQRVFLPHLDASYNLARWLLKNDADAEDVVQEAFLRALRFRNGFRGGDARAWLLTIVRNTAYTWMTRNRGADSPAEFDEEQYMSESVPVDLELIRKADSQTLRAAMDELPPEFREAVVLRDLEDFSYKEIARITEVPIGTVMSRLARARARLKQDLTARCKINHDL